MLSLFSAPLAPGTPAPSFNLPDQDGNRVSLADFRGRWCVLVFYPRDQTPVCTQQLCEFRDAASEWARGNAVVLGINPQGPDSHRTFRDRHSFPFSLLSDAGGHVAAQYHAGWRMLVRRTVYLVNPQGDIAYAARGKPEPSAVLASCFETRI